MPFITLYLPRGCDDGALETSMREITAAGAELLENTLERMIRVTVLEADPERVYQGGAQAEKLAPTVLFRVGPGRSAGAKDAFMDGAGRDGIRHVSQLRQLRSDGGHRPGRI